MHISNVASSIAIISGVILYVVLANSLARYRPGLRGLIVPFAFTLISLYYFVKPMVIPNPYPTMREGMLMTFYGALALLGYAVYVLTRWRAKR